MTEWRATTLGALLRQGGGSIKTGPFGTVLKAAEYSSTGAPVVSVGEVGYGRLRIGQATPRVGPAVVRRLPEYVLRTGDIVFGRKGAVDRSARVRSSEDGYFLGSDGIRVRFGADVDPRFMVYRMQAAQTRAWLMQNAIGTTMASLNQDVLSRVPVRMPPLVEQLAIASALADVDDLIATQERLVAKKQAIKQGMMQQLVAGKARLPGFDGPWKEVRLEDVCIKIQDGTHFSPTLGGSDFRYITSRNVGKGELKLAEVATISETEHRKIYRRCDTRYGDLLLTKDGANTGNVAINSFREEVSLLSSVAFIRCNHKFAQERYLLQYLLSLAGRRQIADLMAGNAITRLTLQKIKNLRVLLPPINEQSAIATALADADRDVTALRRRLAKARAVKQGMMQELLTGRTRLPIAEAVA